MEKYFDWDMGIRFLSNAGGGGGYTKKYNSKGFMIGSRSLVLVVGLLIFPCSLNAQNISSPEDVIFVPLTPPSIGIPTPTPSIPQICEYLSINLTDVTTDSFGGLDPVFVNEIRALGDTTHVGQCLNSKIDEALYFCRHLSTSSDPNHHDLIDDCVAEVLMGRAIYDPRFPGRSQFTLGYPNKSDLPINYGFANTCYEITGSSFSSTFVRPPIISAINRECPSSGIVNNIRYGPIVSGVVYFDSSCNSVDLEPRVEESCSGEVYYRGTPISLLIEGEDLPEKNLVNFALNPYDQSKKVSEWKASSSSPLLVYDPEHTGVINSATQLFGNWTFGGKKSVSLTSAAYGQSMWRDGYEALGSLDQNHDGVISGSELADLGIWSDANRDGISDFGEVKSAVEFGITNLFYKNPVKDPITGDHQLEIGFTRTVGDKLVKGKSVDWFGITANSAEEIVFKKADNEFKVIEEKEKEQLGMDMSIGKSVAVNTAVTGVWEWKSAIKHGDVNEVFSGYLVLNAFDEKLEGYSFSERGIANRNRDGIASEVGVFQILGEKIKRKAYTFKFSKGSESIVSDFELSKNDAELIGKTTIYGKDGKLSYNWIATRKK